MKMTKASPSSNQTPNSQSRQTITRDHYQASGNKPPKSKSRPFIIPIFLPHAGCPHQCVFCNQASITGVKQKLVNPDELRNQIRRFLKYKKKDRNFVEIAFYGGNFLGLKNIKIISLLETAAEFVGDGRVDGIRFSTRPDTIDERNMTIIKNFPVSTVEVGVQSMDDRVLALTGRGHSSSDTVQAVERLRDADFRIGLQMMVGLPGDDETGAQTTAQKIIDLAPEFVRIYPTVVVSNSPLAASYRSGEYAPLTLAEGVTLVKKIYLKFKQAGIGVVRMGLQASEDLEVGTSVLAGPHHPAFGHLVHSEIFWDLALAAIKSANTLKDTLTIRVNPRSISKMRGLNNSNITKLQDRFQLKSVAVKPDTSISEASLIIE